MELVDMKDKTAIVGVGYTPQGIALGRSSMSFMVEASKNAIKDAGLRKEDIDGIILELSPSAPDIKAWQVATHLGINLRFTASEDTWGDYR